MPRWTKSLKQRFEEKFEMIPECGCWIWTAGTGARGYGAFSKDGKSNPAHKASWEIYRGAVPRGMNVCHHCDTPLCVNPHHLFIGTDGDNVRDCMNKGRFLVGERCNHAKLTDGQVGEIRKSKDTIRSLAGQYGVSPSQIWRIRKNLERRC